MDHQGHSQYPKGTTSASLLAHEIKKPSFLISSSAGRSACRLASSSGSGPEQLVKGFKEGNQCQTLLGVTSSGKTFTMANVIQQLNKPTLIIAHNKTLAAQLYGEFKEFFPENAVEYFVS